MVVSLKNIILAGIGSFAYTYEKSMALVDDLVKKGEITVSLGKELNGELKRAVKNDGGTAPEEPLTMTQLSNMLSNMLAGLNLATKDDISQLNERISRIENK